MIRQHKYLYTLLIVLLIGAGGILNATAGAQANEVTIQQVNDLFVAASARANPSVVAIISSRVVQQGSNPWDYLFRNGPQRPSEYQSTALGSGVIINAMGYIVTNNHVVEGAEEIEVMLIDRRMVSAEIIGTDPLSDLAVLKVEANNLQQIDVGDSDALRIGEWVLAIGNPFSQDHSITAGIVSAKGRSDIISGQRYEDFIQTDAAINRGNSGGALVNLGGELIGINTAIVTEGFSQSNLGIGFAIPVNLVMRVVNDLIEYGEVNRAYLGVSMNLVDIDAAMARALGMESPEGVLIDGVEEGTAAERAGIREGDIIIRVDDTPIRNNSHLQVVISSSRPGEQHRISYLRNGRERTANVVFDELPVEASVATMENVPSGDQTEQSRTGFTVADLDSRVSQRTITSLMSQGVEIQASEGVLVTGINPGSRAARVGIERGDIIVKVGDDEIRDVRDFDRALEKYEAGDAVLLRVTGFRASATEVYPVAFTVGLELR